MIMILRNLIEFMKQVIYVKPKLFQTLSDVQANYAATNKTTLGLLPIYFTSRW